MNGLGAGAQGGMPGAGGPGGAAANFPAPAGYTAELSYIHAMVEELSRQLSDNKRVLDDVVTGVGHVRTRAQTQQISNEELIAGASDELQGQQQNLDATISALAEALDAAKYGKEANAQLLNLYATALGSMLKQFHEYKQKHVADVSAWHRSYRHQLAEERAENCRLREQVWQMQEAAGRANANLRAFRAAYDDNPERWERRVADKAARQEIRFWKRMAMPSLSDESSLPSDSALGLKGGDKDSDYWSDDDDLIDGAEKVRLREVERKMAEEQQAQQQAQQQVQQKAQQQQQQQEQQQLIDEQRAMRYQQQQQQQQEQEQKQKEHEYQEMQALQYYQQQQHQEQQQQRQLEQTSRAAAPSEPPTAGDLGQSLAGLSLGGSSDGGPDDDDADSDTKSVILINDTKENGRSQADENEDDNNDDDDDETSLSACPPAVPEAPVSAPAPASIGLMERAVASLGAEYTDDKDDVVVLERPGSAASDESSSSDGSTGSMESSGSDEL